MELLTQIDDAMAFVRIQGGVYKQLPVYARGTRVFVPHGGGFVRVCSSAGDGWSTSSPKVRIIDFNSVPGLSVSGEPCYQPEETAHELFRND